MISMETNGMSNPCAESGFVHLHVHSEFSFLDGAVPLEALVRAAAERGLRALALTDHDHLCGAPEFLKHCQSLGLKPIFGVELTLDTGHITLLAKNRAGYSSLCRLLTTAHLLQERKHPRLAEATLLAEGRELIVLSGCERGPLATLLRGKRFAEARAWAERFRDVFGEDFFIEVQRTLEPGQRDLNQRLTQLVREMSLPVVATNNVHYITKEQGRTQDLLTCIRHLIPLDEPHAERKINRELFLKSGAEMAALFADLPAALTNTARIAERCETYELRDGRFSPRFFDDPVETNRTLRALTYAGAEHRYGGLSPALRARIDYELRVIGELGFADYFLVVRDLVTYARAQKIRHAGRGSAADSVVAYCLDITKVDAFTRNLRFERFINPERAANLPDIDIDFDARYRDRITQYVTAKYGPDHVATVCTYSRFRARGAMRDVAKALGFHTEDVDKLAKSTHWHTSGKRLRQAIENRPELRALHIPLDKYELLIDLCEAIDDLPRQMSTHLGGVVITGDPIQEISPLQMAAKGIHVLQYDKDGVEDLRLLKLDLLCLGTLGAVEDSVQMLTARAPEFDLDRIPLADAATFKLIQSGDTAGAFQIESPAQMALHPRLKTRTYEDIVASVALIRPGPVKGQMVEPFIRRRNGEESIEGLHPAIDRILSHTYGVVLYQEQVVSIAVDLAGFSPGQADVLRRTISHRRSAEKMEEIGRDFVAQAVSNGVERELAEKVFTWLQGYAGFGFCEAHAAAFGDTSYRTAWLLEHHPAEFYAAILSNMPMGFYPSGTIVNEARRRGVTVLNPDVNASGEHYFVEEGRIRVALKQIRGVSKDDIAQIVNQRPYVSAHDFLRRCRLPRDLLENLILAGALDSLHSNRRALLYSLGESLTARAGELALQTEQPFPDLADYSDYEQLCFEEDILGFSPRWHLLEFYRADLRKRQALTALEVRSETRTDRRLRVCGWVIRPHTPPTRSGQTVVFFSLEDETGLLNVTVFPRQYERYGHLLFRMPLLFIEGYKDKRGAHSLIAESVRKWPEESEAK